MPDRRGPRFVVEVVFLVALAAALAIAKVTPVEIAGIMLLGWVLVAALEWAAWRREPHYGSGLPPRYYVPRVSLPPAQPLEQVPAGYPEAQREEAPTWIASAALRAEMLGEWPSSAPARSGEPDEPDEPDEVQPVEDAPPDEPSGAWHAVELPAAPLDDGQPEPEKEPEKEPEPPPVVTLLEHSRAAPVARYSLDPFAEPPRRRRFGRRDDRAVDTIEVPARPPG
ncbi:MAG: hypothetical protein ACRDM1_06470, partial [Gaiellaceae bacterium]